MEQIYDFTAIKLIGRASPSGGFTALGQRPSGLDGFSLSFRLFRVDEKLSTVLSNRIDTDNPGNVIVHLTPDRWVRVMADYGTDGLWERDGVMMDRQDLPVSAELAKRHLTWCDVYERSEFYLDPSERKREFDLPVFAAEGMEIARAIKAELPDWTVVYFDEAKH
jgi:hypothetical protein